MSGEGALASGQGKARHSSVLMPDLIIVLRDGSAAEQGSHEELMRIEGGVYRRLWEAQLTESTALPVEAKDVQEEKA